MRQSRAEAVREIITSLEKEAREYGQVLFGGLCCVKDAGASANPVVRPSTSPLSA